VEFKYSIIDNRLSVRQFVIARGKYVMPTLPIKENYLILQSLQGTKLIQLLLKIYLMGKSIYLRYCLKLSYFTRHFVPFYVAYSNVSFLL